LEQRPDMVWYSSHSKSR